jgi:hypothetical protein
MHVLRKGKQFNEGFQNPTAKIQAMNIIGELKEHIQLGVEAPNKVLKLDQLQEHLRPFNMDIRAYYDKQGQKDKQQSRKDCTEN